jgi:DNA-binding transcriptional regulator YdaS (Cro superfamily)
MKMFDAQDPNSTRSALGRRECHARSRCQGLRAAIDAAGGVSALARLVGVSQPTVSIWTRIPPHRVIAIEALTGVNRRVLRPDLYDVPERVTAVDPKRSDPTYG